MTAKEHYKQHLTEHYELMSKLSEEAENGKFSIMEMLKIIELKLDVAEKLYRLESENLPTEKLIMWY